MNSDEARTALALVAHPRWRWRRGIAAIGARGAWVRVEGAPPADPYGTACWRPDLADAQTQQALLEMLIDVVGNALQAARIAAALRRNGDLRLGDGAAQALLAAWHAYDLPGA